MGKSCIRFKKMEDIPFELIEELAIKLTGEEWISSCEIFIKKKPYFRSTPFLAITGSS